MHMVLLVRGIPHALERAMPTERDVTGITPHRCAETFTPRVTNSCMSTKWIPSHGITPPNGRNASKMMSSKLKTFTL